LKSVLLQIIIHVIQDLVHNNNSSFANCIFYLTKKKYSTWRWLI